MKTSVPFSQLVVKLRTLKYNGRSLGGNKYILSDLH